MARNRYSKCYRFCDIVLCVRYEGTLRTKRIRKMLSNRNLRRCYNDEYKTAKTNKSIFGRRVRARRGGCSSTFDELNKFFTISGMPVASSQYWNSIHGLDRGEAEKDEEGRQVMRTLARNMSFFDEEYRSR